MSIIKKYDGTNFNAAYSINHYDGGQWKNENIKYLDDFTAICFDGTGDYITLPDNTNFEFSSDNFTVDFQVKISKIPTTTRSQIISKGEGQAVGYPQQQFGIDSTSRITFASSSNNSSDNIAENILVGVVIPNTQYHVALSKNGNVQNLYLNGTLSNSIDTTLIPYDSTNGLSIGSDWVAYNTRFFNGYLSNVRISKGIARYTSNFIPSREIPEVDSYTKLLITGKSPIVDEVGNSLTINGNVYSTRSHSSVYSNSNNIIFYNGSNGYLTFAGNSDIPLSTGNFTIDFWFYLISVTGQHTFLDVRPSLAATPYTINVFVNNFSQYNGSHHYTSGITPIINRWMHFAVVRSDSTTKIYIDGTSFSSFTDTVNYTNGNNTCYIGRGIDTEMFLVNGYMSNIRISKGIARYSSNFNPLRTKLSVDSYTKLLITGESPISDKTGKTVTAYGNTYSTKIAI